MNLISFLFLSIFILHHSSSAIIRRDDTASGSLSATATSVGGVGIVCDSSGVCSEADLPASSATATVQNTQQFTLTSAPILPTPPASTAATTDGCGLTSVATIPGCWGTPGCAYYL